MIRLLHLLGVLAMTAAGGVFVFCAVQWHRADGPAESAPFVQPGQEIQAISEERPSPLIAAASRFAMYLAPPPPVPEKPMAQEPPKLATPVVKPPVASPKFKVRGTVCAGPSERSIALIWEPGADNAGRWVKEGAQIGHFVIHEIRPGSVLYLDGEKLCEMALEREATPTTVVANDSGPETPRSQPTADAAHPIRMDGRVKRPTGNNRFTVGSARTTTLD